MPVCLMMGQAPCSHCLIIVSYDLTYLYFGFSISFLLLIATLYTSFTYYYSLLFPIQTFYGVQH